MRTVNSSRQIGYIVREQRAKVGLTQRKLAKQAGVSERLLIALELGDATGIRLDKLLKVLSALGLSLAVLGAGDGDAKLVGSVLYEVAEFPDLDYGLPSELAFESGEGNER